MAAWEQDDFWDDEPEEESKPNLSLAQFPRPKADPAAASARRQSWNRSAVGRARRKDITNLATDEYRQRLASRGISTEGGRLESSPRARIGMKKSQIYHSLGIRYEGHAYGEQQLPGMEDPHAAPMPPRWEDMDDKSKARVNKALAKHGTSIENMSQDFGAQLDQGHWRAIKADNWSPSRGMAVPHSMHFYDEHPGDTPSPPVTEPAQLLRDVSKTSGRDLATVSNATAMTSPNTKFTAQDPASGKSYSPNMETAAGAIHQYDVQHLAPREIGLGRNVRGKSNQGYPANSQKVGRFLQHLDNGGSASDFRNPPTKTNPKGGSPFGPKTGPFANSFNPHIPDFGVGDIHTGGGGMLPHLSTDKPVLLNSAGEPKTKTVWNETENKWKDVPKRDKSEREKAINGTKGMHSAMDYAIRHALGQRGFGSTTSDSKGKAPKIGQALYGATVRQPQAVQWGEEQMQRKEAEPRFDGPSQETAYPHTINQRQFHNPDQGRLF